jgi:hypothetical protein
MTRVNQYHLRHHPRAVATVVGFLGSAALASAQAPVGPPASRPVVLVQGGLLTARASGHSLGAVLEELASRTDVALVPVQEVEQTLVSAHVNGLPLDQGLRELLQNYDTFFYYGSREGASAQLRAVWIYPRGAASVLQPVSPDAWASSRELNALLADSNPTVREQTYEALMSRPDAESQGRVMQAIRGATEFDPALRQRLLSSAISRGVLFPPDLLPHMAASDASEEIRLMALDALAADPEVKTLAEAALSDPSEAVRDRAAQILGAVNSRPGRLR